MEKVFILSFLLVNWSASLGQKNINTPYSINFFQGSNYSELFDASVRITTISKKRLGKYW